jgi:NDP-sugar pyrophosphorylase family protein
MKVMILAAGMGTRLHPLTATCPKPLVPLMLQPMLGHLLTQLRQYHVEEVVINLHHHAEQLRQWIGDGRQWGFQQIHLSYESEILGTAGAIKKAEAVLRDAPFCVINADVLTDVDLAAVWQWHGQRQAVVTMVLRPDPEAHRFGPVMVDGDHRVCQINGRPASKSHLTGEVMMFTGIQVISPQIFAEIPPGQSLSTAADTYPKLIANEAAVYGYRHDGYWMDVGVPTRYRQAHWDFLDGVYVGELASVPNGTHVIRRTEETPENWAHATIKPPVVVGPHVDLGANVRLGPYAVIGAGCQLEAGASVRESVLWDGVRVVSNARVDRCILGTGVVVPANRALSDVVYSSTSETGV